MIRMESQIENAISVAYDPRSSQDLKAQAFEFFNQLRTNPHGWPTCLNLALRSPPGQEVVRVGCLEVVINATSIGAIDEDGLLYTKNCVLQYLRSAYAPSKNPSKWDPYSVENKIVQLLTKLFVQMYQTSWPGLIQDFLGLCSPGTDREAGLHRGVRLYLRLLSSIHDEIGDTLTPRTHASQKLANDLKDLVRERDMVRVAQSWMELLPVWLDAGKDIFNECLIVVGKWASWIDLNLIINDSFLTVLVSSIVSVAETEAAEEAGPAANAMLEILAKKMKPEDKLHLLEIFRLQDIIASISASTRLRDRSSPDYDTDLAELAAKIVNAGLLELVLVAEDKAVSETDSSRALDGMKGLLPYLLRYFADDFDEVCSTVIPSLTEILAFVRKTTSQKGAWAPVLPTILHAIITKMRYDDTSDWGSEESGTEEAEFQDLRKRLEALQQTIATIDETIYVETLRSVVLGTFDAYATQRDQLNWRDLDLALHEMYIFGSTAQKNGPLYNKNKPTTPAAEALIEMLVKMTEVNIARHPHQAVQLQFMELCVRYFAFYDNNPQLIPIALENFTNFIHHSHARVRQRSWYLLLKLIKLLKTHIGNIAGIIIHSVRPLLMIRVDLTKDVHDEDEVASSADGQILDLKFTSQLYLFEAMGCVLSAPGVNLDDQLTYVKAITEPQFADLEAQLPLAKSDDKRAVLQLHHLICALGTMGHGFLDSTPSNVKRSTPVAPELSVEFLKVAEAILVALDSLNSWVQIRDAARTAFARLLGVLGTNILPQLPRWFAGLLTNSSSKDEIASFLRLLGQVVFALNTDIFEFLNRLFTPLLRRILDAISVTTTGTDDEIQLVGLKTHYLSFIQVLLNQGLANVLISAENQPVFDSVIASIEHFAKDPEDLLTAKIAFQVLNKMSELWGGPDTPIFNGTQSQPSLEGFDRFMMERFSPLVWALPSHTAFDPSDGRTRPVLAEAAALQKQITAKVGRRYIEWLRDNELKEIGMGQDAIEVYLSNLTSVDLKGFRNFFVKLAQSIKS